MNNERLLILDTKYIAASSTGFTLPPIIHEIKDLNLMLRSSILTGGKVKNTIDDIRLRSNSTTNKTMKFMETLSSTQ